MSIIDPEDPTLALTRALIARQSVTPDDAGCQQLMMDRLSAAGFICEPMRFAEVDNFWATRGTQGPLLVFAGHTDVVPPGDQSAWQSDPFHATEVGTDLVGRGAADARPAERRVPPAGARVPRAGRAPARGRAARAPRGRDAAARALRQRAALGLGDARAAWRGVGHDERNALACSTRKRAGLDTETSA